MFHYGFKSKPEMQSAATLVSQFNQFKPTFEVASPVNSSKPTPPQRSTTPLFRDEQQSKQAQSPFKAFSPSRKAVNGHRRPNPCSTEIPIQKSNRVASTEIPIQQGTGRNQYQNPLVATCEIPIQKAGQNQYWNPPAFSTDPSIRHDRVHSNGAAKRSSSVDVLLMKNSDQEQRPVSVTTKSPIAQYRQEPLQGTATKSVIALDIDEVLLDLTGGFRRFFQDSFPQLPLPSDLELQDISGDPTSPLRQAYMESAIFYDLPVVSGAVDAVQQLHAMGFCLVAVTSRHISLQEMTQASIDRKFPGMISKIHYTSGQPKGHVCQSIGAWLLVDDSILHVRDAVVHGLSAVLFGEYSWNQLYTSGSLPPEVVHLHGWEDTLEWIMKNGRVNLLISKMTSKVTNVHANLSQVEKNDAVDAEKPKFVMHPPEVVKHDVNASLFKGSPAMPGLSSTILKDEYLLKEKTETKGIRSPKRSDNITSRFTFSNSLEIFFMTWRQVWLEIKADRLKRAAAQALKSSKKALERRDRTEEYLFRQRSTFFVELMKSVFTPWQQASLEAKATRLEHACKQAWESHGRIISYFSREQPPGSLSSPTYSLEFCRHNAQILLAMIFYVWRERLENSKHCIHEQQKTCRPEWQEYEMMYLQLIVKSSFLAWRTTLLKSWREWRECQEPTMQMQVVSEGSQWNTSSNGEFELLAELEKLRNENDLLKVQKKGWRRTCSQLQAELEEAQTNISMLTIEKGLLKDECSLLRMKFDVGCVRESGEEGERISNLVSYQKEALTYLKTQADGKPLADVTYQALLDSLRERRVSGTLGQPLKEPYLE